MTGRGAGRSGDRRGRGAGKSERGARPEPWQGPGRAPHNAPTCTARAPALTRKNVGRRRVIGHTELLRLPGPGRPGNTAPRNHSPGRAGASSLPPHSREEDGYGARAPERVKGPPASPSCLTYPHLDLEDSTGGVGQPGCQLSVLPSGAQYLAYNRHRVNTSPSAPGTHPPGLVGLPRGSSPAAWSSHPADTSKPLANSFFSFALVTL